MTNDNEATAYYETVPPEEFVQRLVAGNETTRHGGAPYRIGFEPMPDGQLKIAFMCGMEKFRTFLDPPYPPELSSMMSVQVDQEAALEKTEAMIELMRQDVKNRRAQFKLVKGGQP